MYLNMVHLDKSKSLNITFKVCVCSKFRNMQLIHGFILGGVTIDILH